MTFRTVVTAFLTLFLCMSLAGGAFAASKAVNVKFPRGASGTSIDGTIRGSDGVRYLVDVAAGQTMSVQLDTDNPGNYFNITAPGASQALFIGSVSGNSTSFQIPSSGKYEINVYLMRNAARRNERANYELTIYVENAAAQARPQPRAAAPAAQAADAVSTDLMPRFCVGEASAKFGVRPQSITANAAFKSGNQYVSQGYFERDGSTTFFNCWFDLGGNFVSVN